MAVESLLRHADLSFYQIVNVFVLLGLEELVEAFVKYRVEVVLVGVHSHLGGVLH